MYIDDDCDTTTRSRQWNCCLNNPQNFGVPIEFVPEWLKSWLTVPHCVFVIGQLEKVDTLHIQFTVNFSQAVRKSALRAHHPKASYGPVGKDNYRIQKGYFYAEKSDTRVEGPWEFGKRPLQMNNAEDRAEKNKLLIHTPIHQLVDEDHISAYHVPTIARAQVLYQESLRASLVVKKPRCDHLIPNDWGFELPVLGDIHKQKHYWFWSEDGNQFKSTFLKKVFNEFRAYYWDYTELNQEPPVDTQFLLFEEYSVPHLTCQTINKLSEGCYAFKQKGGRKVYLDQTPIMIMAGNAHPQNVYPDAYRLIKLRFNVIELTGWYLEPTDDGKEFIYHPNLDSLAAF